jgi:hypothetical protein
MSGPKFTQPYLGAYGAYLRSQVEMQNNGFSQQQNQLHVHTNYGNISFPPNPHLINPNVAPLLHQNYNPNFVPNTDNNLNSRIDNNQSQGVIHSNRTIGKTKIFIEEEAHLGTKKSKTEKFTNTNTSIIGISIETPVTNIRLETQFLINNSITPLVKPDFKEIELKVRKYSYVTQDSSEIYDISQQDFVKKLIIDISKQYTDLPGIGVFFHLDRIIVNDSIEYLSALSVRDIWSEGPAIMQKKNGCVYTYVYCDNKVQGKQVIYYPDGMIEEHEVDGDLVLGNTEWLFNL